MYGYVEGEEHGVKKEEGMAEDSPETLRECRRIYAERIAFHHHLGNEAELAKASSGDFKEQQAAHAYCVITRLSLIWQNLDIAVSNPILTIEIVEAMFDKMKELDDASRLSQEEVDADGEHLSDDTVKRDMLYEGVAGAPPHGDKSDTEEQSVMAGNPDHGDIDPDALSGSAFAFTLADGRGIDTEEMERLARVFKMLVQKVLDGEY